MFNIKFVRIKQCKFESASKEKRKLIILLKMDMSLNEAGIFHKQDGAILIFLTL